MNVLYSDYGNNDIRIDDDSCCVLDNSDFNINKVTNINKFRKVFSRDRNRDFVMDKGNVVDFYSGNEIKGNDNSYIIHDHGYNEITNTFNDYSAYLCIKKDDSLGTTI